MLPHWANQPDNMLVFMQIQLYIFAAHTALRQPNPDALQHISAFFQICESQSYPNFSQSQLLKR